jgi:hypothetical protein
MFRGAKMLADVRQRWEKGILRGMAWTRRMLAESAMRSANGEITDEVLNHYQQEAKLLKESSL